LGWGVAALRAADYSVQETQRVALLTKQNKYKNTSALTQVFFIFRNETRFVS
jgi:hypothetical protein